MARTTRARDEEIDEMARRTTTGAAAGVVGVGLVLVLSGCAADGGPQVARDIEISDVSRVELAMSGDLSVRRGSEPSLTVTASEGTHARLVSEVRDGVLVLDSRSTFGFNRMGDVHYELVVGELAEVVLTGSGDVEADDVTGDDVEVRLEGSGDVTVRGVDASAVQVSIDGSGSVELEGRAGSADLRIGGSGDVDAEDLRVDDADVRIDGSGEVDVDAVRRLAVAIGGAGTVTYPGDPEVTQQIDGSGSVRRD